MTKKEHKRYCYLNKIYEPMIEAADKFKKMLEDKGFEVKAMFGNKHYAEYKGEWVCELYPLRILDVKYVGDFVFDFETISFEKYCDAKELINFNLEKIIETFGNKQLDFYGQNDCCKSLYVKGTSTDELRKVIKSKGKEPVAINFKIDNYEKDINFILENLVLKEIL